MNSASELASFAVSTVAPVFDSHNPEPIPSYEPSNSVTLMWSAFGVQSIATLYILCRGVVLPENARTFHRIFGAMGLVASVAYLFEAGALEYIDLLHDKNLSAAENASSWRLPCNTPPHVDLTRCETSSDTPMCTIIPYYISRIIIQSLMVYGIAFLAGTPKREHFAAMTCVAVMECCNFLATLSKSIYESISLLMVWTFALRLFFMIPLIYFLLHGIEHNIRRAPMRVRGVCHGWCGMMVILQLWNLLIWCLTYGTNLLSLSTLLSCRILADMTNTVIIPLLVLRDIQLLMLVRDRDERVMALNKYANDSKHLENGRYDMHLHENNESWYINKQRNDHRTSINYIDRVMIGIHDDRDHSIDDYDDYEGYHEDEFHLQRTLRSDTKGSSTTAKSLNHDLSTY